AVARVEVLDSAAREFAWVVRIDVIDARVDAGRGGVVQLPVAGVTAPEREGRGGEGFSLPALNAAETDEDGSEELWSAGARGAPGGAGIGRLCYLAVSVRLRIDLPGGVIPATAHAR